MSEWLEVYSDERYMLGLEGGLACLRVGDARYRLTCHPYEPCLYITDGEGRQTAVHNSFDPLAVLESFQDGNTVTSITGMEYDAEDFCRMVEYAAGRVDIQIDDAEKVFGGRAKRKNASPGTKPEDHSENLPEHGKYIRPERGSIIDDDPFLDLVEEYPDSVVDFRLVRNDHRETGLEAHRKALVQACCSLMVEDDGEPIWHFDAGKAESETIGVEELLAPVLNDGTLNYRKAFLQPPYTNGYTDADFERINATLFPNGTDNLEICRWTTGWSDYFDDGHEWWGTLCLTVYDRSLDRFTVVLASATD